MSVDLTMKPIQLDEDTLRMYSLFLSQIFPKRKRFSLQYMKWLYVENPNGPALGFDAWFGEQLAAHYVCVPHAVVIHGQRCRALLSLNTATAPEFRGQGLFVKLASRTYEEAAHHGFDLVFGVGNAQSTPGLVRRLGFHLVGPLTACVGFGAGEELKPDGEFRVDWDSRSLTWRLTNPENPVYTRKTEDGTLAFFARTHIRGIWAWCRMATRFELEANPRKEPFVRLFLGSLGGARPLRFALPIPKMFRPSPLNLVVLPLKPWVSAPTLEGSVFSFLDFDAY